MQKQKSNSFLIAFGDLGFHIEKVISKTVKNLPAALIKNYLTCGIKLKINANTFRPR